jgi:hypothetical protein
MRRAILLTFVLGALLGACDNANRPVSGPGGNLGPAVAPKPIVQVPNRGLGNPRPTTIDRVSFEGDRSKLRVTYWGGVEDCYGLDRVDQRWNKDSVVLTVFTGTKRLPANTACDDIAVSLATVVGLQQELGNRRVIDGNTGQPAQWR